MGPTTQECRIELERILKSDSFSQSERHRSFLGYIVEETLAGRGDRIKGYTIAVEVFGKPAEFDAQNDPYVRVEAGRLRKRLSDYYRAEGAANPIRIEFKRGNYAPEFRFARAEKAARTEPSHAIPPGARSGLWSPLRAVVVLGIGVIGIGYLISRESADPQSPTDGSPPSVRVQTFEDIGNTDFQHFADGLNQEILLKLDRYASFWGPINVFHGDDLAELEISDQQDFRLDGTVSHIGDSIQVTARLIDLSTGKQLWTDGYDLPYVLTNLASIQDDIAAEIANTIREPFGPVADAEVSQIAGRSPDRLSAYECNVSFIHAVDMMSRSTRQAAKSCLQRYDRTDSLDAAGLGALSFLYRLDYDDGLDYQSNPGSLLAAAYDAAQRAVDRNGNDVLAQMAMAFVHLAHQRFDQARASTERLMGLNPPTSTLGIVSVLMLELGDREAGKELFEAALKPSGRPTPSLYVGPALYYMERGDYETALGFAERIDAPEFTMYQVFWAALSAHLGQMSRAQLNADEILAMHPDFSDYGRELLQRWSLPPNVEEVLITGLERAGIELNEARN